MLKQFAVVSLPLPRIFIILALITRRTCDDQIGRIVSTTLCYWNNVVNMVFVSQLALAPIATSFLRFVLALNINNRMMTTRRFHTGVSVASMGSALLFVSNFVIFAMLDVAISPVFHSLQTEIAVICPIKSTIFAPLIFSSLSIYFLVCEFMFSNFGVVFAIILFVMIFVRFMPRLHVRFLGFTPQLLSPNLLTMGMVIISASLLGVSTNTVFASVIKSTWSILARIKIIACQWKIAIAAFAMAQFCGHTTPRLVLGRHGVRSQGSDETTFSGINLDYIYDYSTSRGR